jgi:energy-coupling factor transporter transmembrane protein EcfT
MEDNMKPLKILAGMGFVVAIVAVIGTILCVLILLFGLLMGGLFGSPVDEITEFVGCLLPMILTLGWLGRRAFIQSRDAWTSDDDLFIDAR